MVDLLDPRPGDRLLEIAAGSGDTGFLAATRIRPGGSLLSTDSSPEMVESARRRAAELGCADVTFATADATALGLPDGSFDGVLCKFGLMLVPERAEAAAEIARVLRPGGRAVIAVWAEPARNPLMTVAGRAAVELGLTDPPDPGLPGPFRLSDPHELHSLIESTGLTVTTIDEVPVLWTAASLDEWWASTCDMSPSLGALLARLPADAQRSIPERAGRLLAPFVANDGSLAVPGVARAVLAQR